MAEQDYLEDLARALSRGLAEADLAIAQAAKKAGLSTNTLSAAVNAKRGKATPSERTVTRIARICGADPGPLLELQAKAHVQRQVAAADALPVPSGPDWLITADSSEPPERHFNPLRRENLIRSVASALSAVDPVPLEDLSRKFDGLGVYALYYVGPNPLYRPVSQSSCETPVYIAGAERGGTRLSGAEGRSDVLSMRLDRHRRTLRRATDLAPEDFRVRHLLTDDLFIAGAEQLAIKDHLPVWNVALPGFGIHLSRGMRDRTPPWHILHHGAVLDRAAPAAEDIEEWTRSVRRHLSVHATPSRTG